MISKCEAIAQVTAGYCLITVANLVYVFNDVCQSQISVCCSTALCKQRTGAELH